MLEPSRAEAQESRNNKEGNKMTERFDFPKEKGLQTYTAIYVPSTKDVNRKISKKEHEKRVAEVRNFLTRKFGGTSTDKRVGSYTSHGGRVVQEDVAVVATDWISKNQSRIDQWLGK